MWDEIKAARQVWRESADEWSAECGALGGSFREATFGAIRLAAACMSWTGWILTDVAAMADAALEDEKRNPANASFGRTA